MYKALTRESQPGGVNTAGLEDWQIWIIIALHFDGEDQVVLTTKEVQPDLSPLAGGHAYLVTAHKELDTNGDGIHLLLYNTWAGEQHAAPVKLDFQMFASTLGAIYKLNDIQ